MAARDSHRPRFLVPEVIQTSAMDCGPAALKCLLEGFRIHASYGRLREACQTDVDGTSIDSMEEVANQLGLDAEQVMVPLDHVLIPEAGLLPAIAVVRLSNQVIHFLVIWRCHGSFVQVMDPATGRRWVTREKLLRELHPHTLPIDAQSWREWAASKGFLLPLRARLRKLGVRGEEAERLIDSGLADPGWRSLALLDAATRMTETLARARALPRGMDTSRFLTRIVGRGREDPEFEAIPDSYWSVTSDPQSSNEDETPLLLRGAVLVSVPSARVPAAGSEDSDERRGQQLSPELVAALEEPAAQPGKRLWELLRADGLFAPAVILAALLLASAGVVLEALLFRGLFDISQDLGLSGQRLGAISALMIFVTALLLLEIPIAGGVLRLGRKLETRLRLAFLEKIPRLTDRYFKSRLTSDMAERSHLTHSIRDVPAVGSDLARTFFELALTTAGIIWIDPAVAPLAVVTAVLAVVIPLIAQSWLIERDLRVRTHGGALSLFYLDALRGLLAIRSHGGQRAVRREHESLLTEWGRAGLGLQRAAVIVEGIQQFGGFALAAALLISHYGRVGESSSVLLIVYWALNLPYLGQEVALTLREYPSLRNATLRLLEPLGAREDSREPGEDGPEITAAPSTAPRGGIALTLDNVSVRLAGRTVLQDLRLEIPAGSHVAIVGPSGAGKSSLVGLFLGWHRAAQGSVQAGAKPLAGETLRELRQATAWVDPSVQLWNRTLLDNLCYGNPGDKWQEIGAVIDATQLGRVLETLPDGLQTPLGESGGLVSGGEGQRVRLGRAFLRPDVRLVILDEPFRGLDRSQRRELLERARRLWSDATLLCITHDVRETLSFERVIVMDGGRITEEGNPETLADLEGSRYRDLLEAERATHERLWQSGEWRQLTLEGGPSGALREADRE